MSTSPVILHTVFPEELLRRQMSRVRIVGLVMCVVLIGASSLCAGMFVAERESFYRAYLFAYVFWTGLCQGNLTLCLLHNLTSGKWGMCARRLLEAGTASLPYLILAALPLAIAALTGHVWPWAQHLIDPVSMPHKARFFSPAGIAIRTTIIATIFISMSMLVLAGTRRRESADSYPAAQHVARLSGIAIVILVLAFTLLGMDWLMSLTPEWYSTVYALIFICGQTLSAFCAVIILLATFLRYEPFASSVTRDHLNDLASLMFAFIILWAYLSFSQLLISWMGNLKTEMMWYVPRTTGGWGMLAIAIILFQFFAPFLLLLNRRIKRSPRILLWVAAGVLLMHAADIYWIIKPAFASDLFPDRRTVSWFDPVLIAGLGGYYVWVFGGRLLAAPLSPPALSNDWNDLATAHQTAPGVA